MRRHVHRVTGASALLTALLVATLAGCGGDATPSGGASPPSGGASPTPGVAATATAAPSPSVALREPHSLVLSTTGTSTVTSVTFELDDHKVTKRSVPLPWREVVDVPADGKLHRWSLTMKHRSGRVELVAIFDGAVVGKTKGRVSGGTGTASVGGSLRG